MLIKAIIQRAKSYAEAFSRPQTYGSELEYYIVSNNPQNEGDVDRLQREFNQQQSSFVRGF